MTPDAEKFNGWAAMIGFVAAFGAYATTGQIIPGIFWKMTTSTPSLTTKKALVVTEYGKQNMFAYESPMQFDENYTNYPEEAEKANGRWAMIGFLALILSYVFTGQVLPGVFW